MKPILGLLLFVTIFAAAGIYLQRQHPHPVYFSLCRIVEQGYYTQDQRLKLWAQGCKSRASGFSAKNKSQLLQHLRNELSLLGGSHLEIYEPAAHQRMWASKSAGDTGLRARFVEGELVVYEVLPESVAASHKIKPGTIIKEVDGEHPSEVAVESSSGNYRIKRPGQPEEDIVIEPTSLLLDEAPRIIALAEKTGYLKVPSFRGEFFEDQKWNELAGQIGQHDRVVLDLRNNLGGNLIAGMRLLGSLLCSEQDIGHLVKGYSRQLDKDIFILQNDLSDKAQLEQISADLRVHLQSFTNGACERPEIAVLIDHNSSSTAEIVALALKEHSPQTILMGTPSAGQVLIAVWYNFSELGDGYSISVPERRFVSHKGQELEGVGVQPDQQLYYKLSDAIRGEDSWVNRARQALLSEGPIE